MRKNNGLIVLFLFLISTAGFSQIPDENPGSIYRDSLSFISRINNEITKENKRLDSLRKIKSTDWRVQDEIDLVKLNIDRLGDRIIEHTLGGSLALRPYNGNVRIAGQNLKTAGTLMYWAVGLNTVGMIVAIKANSVVGVIIMSAGSICGLIAPSYIIAAGEKLENTTGLAK